MGKKSYLLGIDVGTGSVKAALFDELGRLAGFGQHEYAFQHPKPMWSELPPQTVWERTALSVRDCMASGSVDPGEIAGVGISCIGDTGIALDGRGEPLYPAIECTDQRSGAYREYVELFEREIGGERIYEATGYPLSSLPPVHKILWLRDNLPSVYSGMERYGTFQEYLLWKMTGRPCVDYSLASRTMAFDLVGKRWLTEFLDAVSIPARLFSEAVPSSHVVGALRGEAAGFLGLPAGLPVVAGAHDQCCTAMGMGLASAGMAGDGTGSVEALLQVGGAARTSSESREFGIGCQCHSLPDTYLSIAFQLTAGSLVRWYRDQFGGMEKLEAARTGRDAYDILTAGAEGSRPGSNGLMLLPHFLGSGTCRKPPLNADSRGVLLGMSLSHTKNDVTRAIFEGITYETRYLLEGLTAGGDGVDAIVVTGGAAKSPFWLQMKADITGKRILVPEVTETSCLGAAMLAGLGTGVYDGYDAASSKACRFAREYKPDAERHREYSRYYDVYRDVYDSVTAINARLAGLMK